jgi:acyl-coenzyme A synthetase/AMP-(fatty) acid ligase
MTYSTLSNLLVADRNPKQLVACSVNDNKNWENFSSDVSELTEHLSIQIESRWALCCEDSYLFAVGLFALAYANKKIVLPGNHQPEMFKLLADKFDGLISDGLRLEDPIKKHCSLPFHGQTVKSITQPLDIENITLTLFTSGSSGSPKAITKTLALLNAEIISLEKQWGDLLENTHIVSTVSHQHIYGLLFRVLWPLCAGRSFQRVDFIYPEQLANGALAKNTLISSPALLKRLTETTIETGYRAIFSSGGPLSYQAAVETKLNLKQTPIEVFGSTETGGIGFRQQRHEFQAWETFSDLQITVNEQSCLKIKSPWIDFNIWYQTSDQCELLDEQHFVLKGRIDRVVKIEEKRVSLNEVEQRVNELPWINETAIILLNQQQRLSLGAVICLNQQGKDKLLELGKGKFWVLLRQQLRRWITPIAVPRYFRIIEDIPVNKQGKRLHNELLALFDSQGGV